MIKVKLTSNELHISGHAQRGKKQSLRVCAAVSVLVHTLAETFPSRDVHRCKKDNVWQFQGPHVHRPQTWFVLKALRRLAEKYPRNIKLTEVADDYAS